MPAHSFLSLFLSPELICYKRVRNYNFEVYDEINQDYRGMAAWGVRPCSQ
jgi:hypothetical protein